MGHQQNIYAVRDAKYLTNFQLATVTGDKYDNEVEELDPTGKYKTWYCMLNGKKVRCTEARALLIDRAQKGVVQQARQVSIEQIKEQQAIEKARLSRAAHS